MSTREEAERIAIRDFAEANVELANNLPVGYFKRLREEGKMLDFVGRFADYRRTITGDKP